MELESNLKKRKKVWVVQQAVATQRAGGLGHSQQEVKYHSGIKYERKQNSLFEGKLVTQAQILSIDGEDYVKYRALMKPSFL